MTEIEAIEQELSETRENLEDHVEELAEKLTIGGIVDEFVLGDRVNWPEITRNDTLYKLVIPGALVGAGAAMFLAGGGISKISELLGGDKDRAGDEADDYDPSADLAARRLGRSLDALDRNLVRTPGELDAAYAARRHDEYAEILEIEREDGETDESLGARIKSAREKAAHAAEEAGHRIEAAAAKAKHAAQAAMADSADTVKHAGEKAKEAASAGRSQYEDNPALAIAISTAVGALIGTLTPMSKKEEELLSEPVDKAAEKLAAGARATAETAQRAAERIHEATRGVRKAEAQADAEAAAGHM